jgi:hypothetical protein
MNAATPLQEPISSFYLCQVVHLGPILSYSQPQQNINYIYSHRLA